MSGLPKAQSEAVTPAARRNLITSVVYAAMLVGAVLAYLAIRLWGETLVAPGVASQSIPGQSAVAVVAKGDALLHVLIALLAVIITGTALGRVFAFVGQPPVIGEVIAGILLGPSLLGRIAPDLYAFILPDGVKPMLWVIAQLGVVLYMFLVGLDLNAGLLRRRAHATVVISHASIIVPFLLGATLALWLYPRLSNSSVGFTNFSLFVGVAMSITAFPVLARILTDRRIEKTELGTVAISCAAIDDVTAWCLLAFVVGVTQAKVGAALTVAALTIAYIAAMFLIVRPGITRLAGRLPDRPLPRPVVAVVFAGLLLSAVATELIGIHAIFGAFMLGAIIPHDSPIARQFTSRFHELVTILLLPAFFAYTGMRTEIGLVSGLDQWLLCGAIIVVATLGKFGGTLAAARLSGLDWRMSSALGILMNTRGLMELIVLNIGLDMQVISPTLFAMMVLMALATTIATTPVLQLLLRGDGSLLRTSASN